MNKRIVVFMLLTFLAVFARAQPYWDATNGEQRIGDSSSVYNLNYGGDSRLGLLSSGTNNKFRMTTYGSNYTNWIACNRSRGVPSAPTALVAGDVFCSMVGVGHYGNYGWAHGPEIVMRSPGDWTSSSTPGGFTIYAVKPGQTTQVPVINIAMNGGYDFEQREGDIQIQKGRLLMAIGAGGALGALQFACGSAPGTGKLVACVGSECRDVPGMDNMAASVPGC